MPDYAVRPATPDDLEALTDIYNHYVVNTAMTFDLRTFAASERRGWFDDHRDSGPHRLLVATDARNRCVGYASSSRWRPKPAYNTTVETSVYCHPEALGRGCGTALYTTLFAALESEDVHRMVAGVSLPNPASVSFHERFDFRRVGVFHAVGRKFDKFWDVAWFDRPRLQVCRSSRHQRLASAWLFAGSKAANTSEASSFRNSPLSVRRSPADSASNRRCSLARWSTTARSTAAFPFGVSATRRPRRSAGSGRRSTSARSDAEDGAGIKDTLSSERPRVAILGTGKMGSAIARRLATVGLDLVLWNRTRARAEALGVGMVADTPAAAVRDVDIVISSLTGPEAVRTVYLGTEGALTLGGKHFIEMSTAGADLPAQIQPKVVAAGGTLVDAPILGAPPFVHNGQATVITSGADDDVHAVLPLLRQLGAVRHVGALGSASRLKLLANSMLADVILAAGELQVAGEAAGLNAGDVFWVLERLVPSLEARRAGLVDDHHTPALFALRDLRKDVEFAFALFQRTAARTPITGRARELVAAAAAAAPDADITALAKPYRDRERSLED